jgi:hypothetical protein
MRKVEGDEEGGSETMLQGLKIKGEDNPCPQKIPIDR